MEILLARAEGADFPDIEAHLARCASCKATIERLYLSITKAHSGGNASIAELLRQMLAELDGQMQKGAKRGRGRQLAELLELYFGKEAAGRIGIELRDCDSPDLSVSLFQAFLGRKAAAAVAHQISRAGV